MREPQLDTVGKAVPLCTCPPVLGGMVSPLTFPGGSLAFQSVTQSPLCPSGCILAFVAHEIIYALTPSTVLWKPQWDWWKTWRDMVSSSLLFSLLGEQRCQRIFWPWAIRHLQFSLIYGDCPRAFSRGFWTKGAASHLSGNASPGDSIWWVSWMLEGSSCLAILVSYSWSLLW